MKLLIKPSKDGVTKAKETIKDVFSQKKGRPVGDLIMKLNPIIRDNIWSRRKLAKQSNYKCRVCNQSLVGEEELKINQIIPKY